MWGHSPGSLPWAHALTPGQGCLPYRWGLETRVKVKESGRWAHWEGPGTCGLIEAEELVLWVWHGMQSRSINEGICGYDAWDSIKLGTFQGVSKWGEQSAWGLLMGPGQWWQLLITPEGETTEVFQIPKFYEFGGMYMPRACSWGNIKVNSVTNQIWRQNMQEPDPEEYNYFCQWFPNVPSPITS